MALASYLSSVESIHSVIPGVGPSSKVRKIDSSLSISQIRSGIKRRRNFGGRNRIDNCYLRDKSNDLLRKNNIFAKNKTIMKNITSAIVAIVALLATFSCDALHSVSNNEVNSQGAPYELIIVCNQPQWEGALGDTLREIFTAEIPYLQQKEPIFDVLRVTEQGYNNLVVRHRNILRVVIDPAVGMASAAVQYDLNATPQVVVTVRGSSEADIAEYISINRAKLVEVLEGAEQDRAVKYAQRFTVRSINALIESKFGFTMRIPEGYTVRNEGENFLWLSYEYPTASQGLLIYSYPATRGVKSLMADDLTKARNKFTANIPGPVDGSYMTTFMDYTPDYSTFRIDGRLWAELRGLWNVKGDFMGGPFVSYSTIDTVSGDVITIDGYVYSPKLPKRNFMRGIEHLIYNVSFPTENE